MKGKLQLVIIPVAIIGALVLLLSAERRPGLFANATYLSGLVAFELVLACLWRFQKVFFPVTIGCFLLAGTGLPLSGESTTLRWLFLAVGALAGLIIWIKSTRAQHFGLFHLVALFCVFAAVASASVSDAPATAMLKVLSLFLLFLYASTGARVALAGREQSFVRGLVLACEILLYLTAACYFALGYELFGSPNALGAVIGVAITPVMLWAALVAESRKERQRRYIALALCGALLYVSVCRAAILADAVLLIVLTIALRRPRLLVRAAFAAALSLELMAVANPSRMAEFTDSLTGKFIFKNEANAQGVFGSRQSPWDETISAVKQHPWFGTGFGTSGFGKDRPYNPGSSISDEGSNREHGSSYLALAEYMGLLGISPFLLLLLLLTRAAARVCAWMRRTGGPSHYAVPFALIAVAGLVHAGFEDWLFAAGSYLCVFFWASAFLLIDLAATLKADLKISTSTSLAPLAPPLALRQPTT